MDQESSSRTAGGPGREHSSNGSGGRRVSCRLRGSEPGRRALTPLPARPGPRAVARPAGPGSAEPLDLVKNQVCAGRDKSGDASGLLAATVVPIPVDGEANGPTSVKSSAPTTTTSEADCLQVRPTGGRAGLGFPAGALHEPHVPQPADT